MDEISTLRKAMSRLVNGTSGAGGGGGGKTGGSVVTAQKMSPEQIAQYWFNDRTPGALIEIPLEDEEIFEPETEALMEKVAEKMKLIEDRTKHAAIAMSAFGQAFGYAADLAGDNAFGDTLQALSGVANAAV